MNFEIHDHFARIIFPQLKEYFDAERELTKASIAGDSEMEGYDALRKGTNATWHMHHFADLMFSRLYQRASKRGEISGYIKDVQARHDNQEAPKEVLVLLGDTADALKHGILGRDSLVCEAGQVLVVGRGYGTGGYGRGKFGGRPQVWIFDKHSRRHSLEATLKTAAKIWVAEMETQCGVPLEEHPLTDLLRRSFLAGGV